MTEPLSESQVPAGERAGTDPRETLGRIFHEQGRLTVNAERERPFILGEWPDRTPEQQEIDMRGAAAVAAEALRGYEAERAEAEVKVLAHILGIAGSEEEPGA